MSAAGMHIGLFQYDLPLQSYSRDLAIKLCEMGAMVDFHGFRLGTRELVSRQTGQGRSIAWRDYDDATPALTARGWTGRVLDKIRWRVERRRARERFGADLHFLDRTVLLSSLADLEHHDYDLFIGIEKQGLIWAGMMGEHLGVPHLYYSLELYLEDHPMMQYLGHLRAAERKFHRRAVAAIVQDPFRARALREANGAAIPEILMPVAVRGPVNSERTSFLRERLSLPGDSVILLFFGGMSESRMCEQIIDSIDYLPEQFVIVFHGYSEKPDYYGRLVEQARGRPVHFSPADLRENELDLLIASADIGFALYRNDNVNDRFTAYSSQKIALFCRNGVPFVSNRNEAYENLFQRFHCGEMASSSEEIAVAALRIHAARDAYRAACFRAFEAIYNFDEQFEPLRNYIESRSWGSPISERST